METQNKKSAAEYAKNYPQMLKDTPLAGPVTVGNINEYDGRVIINLCLRTARSGEKNATISFPNDWTKARQFAKGDLVNVRIEDGFVKNIYAAKPESIKTSAKVSASKVNEEVQQSSDDQAAGEAAKKAADEAMAKETTDEPAY